MGGMTDRGPTTPEEVRLDLALAEILRPESERLGRESAERWERTRKRFAVKRIVRWLRKRSN